MQLRYYKIRNTIKQNLQTEERKILMFINKNLLHYKTHVLSKMFCHTVGQLQLENV